MIAQRNFNEKIFSEAVQPPEDTERDRASLTEKGRLGFLGTDEKTVFQFFCNFSSALAGPANS